MTGRAGSHAARERQEAKLAGATAASSPRTAPQPAVEPAASARQGSGCSVPGNRGRPETPALGAEASAAPCAAPGGRGHGFLQWRFWFHGRGVFSGTRDRLRFLPWSPGRGVGGSPRPTRPALSSLPSARGGRQGAAPWEHVPCMPLQRLPVAPVSISTSETRRRHRDGVTAAKSV